MQEEDNTLHKHQPPQETNLHERGFNNSNLCACSHQENLKVFPPFLFVTKHTFCLSGSHVSASMTGMPEASIVKGLAPGHPQPADRHVV